MSDSENVEVDIDDVESIVDPEEIKKILDALGNLSVKFEGKKLALFHFALMESSQLAKTEGLSLMETALVVMLSERLEAECLTALRASNGKTHLN